MIYWAVKRLRVSWTHSYQVCVRKISVIRSGPQLLWLIVLNRQGLCTEHAAFITSNINLPLKMIPEFLFSKYLVASRYRPSYRFPWKQWANRGAGVVMLMIRKQRNRERERRSVISNYHYLKQIFLSVHFLIGVQWLGTNCQIKHVRWGILLALNSPYLRI